MGGACSISTYTTPEQALANGQQPWATVRVHVVNSETFHCAVFEFNSEAKLKEKLMTLYNCRAVTINSRDSDAIYPGMITEHSRFYGSSKQYLGYAFDVTCHM